MINSLAGEGGRATRKDTSGMPTRRNGSQAGVEGGNQGHRVCQTGGPVTYVYGWPTSCQTGR